MTDRNRTVSLVHYVALSSLFLAGWSAAAIGQTTTKVVQENGVTWQETHQMVQRMVPTTQYQTRQEQVYQPQTSTTMHTYQQNYLTPVTEYRWVARRRGVLNPFVQPYWTNQLEPFTRWENRPATVQVPVAKTDWVATTRTVSTPVTTYTAVNEDRLLSKVAISGAPASTTAQPATAIASRPLSPMGTQPPMGTQSPIGGQQLQSDPPRTASGWTSASGGANRYR